jgi:ABC-type phosphate/phosphonate transport system substrate-binding protein
MPKGFRFPDQASPSAYLLPLTQATTQGSTLMVDEGGHANTLIQPTAPA